MSNVITFCMTDNSRCNIIIHGEHDVGKGAIKVFLLLNKLAAVAIKYCDNLIGPRINSSYYEIKSDIRYIVELIQNIIKFGDTLNLCHK